MRALAPGHLQHWEHQSEIARVWQPLAVELQVLGLDALEEPRAERLEVAGHPRHLPRVALELLAVPGPTVRVLVRSVRHPRAVVVVLLDDRQRVGAREPVVEVEADDDGVGRLALQALGEDLKVCPWSVGNSASNASCSTSTPTCSFTLRKHLARASSGV